MNSEEFIAAIKNVIRESAIEGMIENLEDPPGRNIFAFDTQGPE